MVCNPSSSHPACKKCKLFDTLKPRTKESVIEVLRQKKASDEDEDDKEDEDGDSPVTSKVYVGEKVPLDNPFADCVWFDRGEATLGFPIQERDDHILVIGEPLGRAYEDSGNFWEWNVFQKLFTLWESLGILDRVVYVPVTRCYSPYENGKPKISVHQLGYCFTFTADIIREIKPKAIIPLGYDACRALTKRGDDFNLSGRVYHWTDIDKTTYAVIPQWGYAFIQRDEKRFSSVYRKNWTNALDLIDSSTDLSSIKQEVDYDLALTVEDFEKWFSIVDSDTATGFDVETVSLKNRGVWDDNFYITIASFSHPAQKKPLIIPLRYGFTLVGEKPNRWELRGDSVIASFLEDNKISLAEWEARVPLLEEAFLKVMVDRKIHKIGHNLKFDSLAVFRCYGKKILGVEHDTMLMSYGLNPDVKRLNALDDLIRKYLPNHSDYHHTLDNYFAEHPEINGEYALLPPDILFPYAALDTQVLNPLVELMERDMRAVDNSLDNESSFVHCGGLRRTYSLSEYILFVRRQHLLLTTELESNGVYIDKTVLDICSTHYNNLLSACSKTLENHPDVIGFQSDKKKGIPAMAREKVLKKLEKGSEALYAKSEKKVEKLSKFSEEWPLASTKRRNKLLDMWSKVMPVPDTFDSESDSPPTIPAIDIFVKAEVKKVLDTTQIPDLNWGSVFHVRQFFYAYKGYEVVHRSPKGAPSTAEEALVHLASYGKDEVAKLLLEFRELSKFVDGFLYKLTTDDQEKNFISNFDNCIHPSFGIDSTGTSRLTACVDGDTKVDTLDGVTPISQLKVGDKVLTHEGRYRKVLAVYTKGVQQMFKVVTTQGNSIICTSEHRFLTGNGWESLSDAPIGVLTMSHKVQFINGIHPAGERLVWDIHVEEDNSYVAQGFINHNSKPNVQQIPSGGYIKRVYGSRYPNGWLLQRDYSGIEVRILALLSGDLGLREAFLNGEDVHFRTQKFFFKELADKSNKPQRTICKGALFGRVYGQGDKGLFENLTKNRVISPLTGEPIEFDECVQFNAMIDASYPGVAEWIKDAQRQARRTGYATSAFGFLRHLDALKSYFVWERMKQEDWKAGRKSAKVELLGSEIHSAQRKAQNTPVQSTAADLTVISASVVAKRMKKLLPDVKLCNIVHDSLWSDCPDIHQAARAMWLKRDVMDRMDYWLPTVLPDYDASWIDIPIIGESEIGINAKDTFTVYKEPEFDGDTFWVKFFKEDSESVYDSMEGSEVGEGKGQYKVVDFVKNVGILKLHLEVKKSAY